MKNLSLERRDELFQTFEKTLKEKLGENKYALIIAYEAAENPSSQTGQMEIDMVTHKLTNLDPDSPMHSWKLILEALLGHVQEFINVYDINNNEVAQPKRGIK